MTRKSELEREIRNLQYNLESLNGNFLAAIEVLYGDNRQEFFRKLQEREAQAKQAANQLSEELGQNYEELERQRDEAVGAAETAFREGEKALALKENEERKENFLSSRLGMLKETLKAPYL